MEEPNTSALSYASGYADGKKDATRIIKTKILAAMSDEKPFDELQRVIVDIFKEGD